MRKRALCCEHLTRWLVGTCTEQSVAHTIVIVYIRVHADKGRAILSRAYIRRVKEIERKRTLEW